MTVLRARGPGNRRLKQSLHGGGGGGCTHGLDQREGERLEKRPGKESSNHPTYNEKCTSAVNLFL
jgi:hypothetical protein